ncbi:DNA alkylation repair enzyme [Planococcus massiliensis]|uniref:DNA alkylation repair enzyme n=1 Tax=Planococcus massiliensis TaxID=1499687 RepID=A0A098ELN6_9BACL|nr:DNA alkylation repair protein [Planococcus massiliensis]CEG22727.1 DNA alkylation repair enzyme [Planococcus massiliensis]
MDRDTVLKELEALGTERTKKRYLSNGAREPLFGVATGAMKPLAKKIKKDQALADELYATGNFDAMYFAGVISDMKTPEEFDRWMEDAYFFMLSDYVVAVSLAEAPFAQELADKWIASGEELKRSAGWSCYCWLLGRWPDSAFDKNKLSAMLDQAKEQIHDAPDRTKVSLNNFILTTAISFEPLHEKAVETAAAVGPVEIRKDEKKSSTLLASEAIQKAVDRGQLGFKRKYVRC